MAFTWLSLAGSLLLTHHYTNTPPHHHTNTSTPQAHHQVNASSSPHRHLLQGFNIGVEYHEWDREKPKSRSKRVSSRSRPSSPLTTTAGIGGGRRRGRRSSSSSPTSSSSSSSSYSSSSVSSIPMLADRNVSVKVRCKYIKIKRFTRRGFIELDSIDCVQNS